MGRIVASSFVSLDGYTEGAGGDLSAMPFDGAFNAHNAELMASAAGVLFGGRFFRQAVGYWPTASASPDPAERSIAERYASGLPLTVVSDSLTAEETGPWREQTTIVSRADGHDAVRRLREAEGDTVTFGGQTLWSDLLAHGLVDVLHLLVGPGIVAGDTPALAGVPPTRLRLLDVGRFPESETVRLTYSARTLS